VSKLTKLLGAGLTLASFGLALTLSGADHPNRAWTAAGRVLLVSGIVLFVLWLFQRDRPDAPPPAAPAAAPPPPRRANLVISTDNPPADADENEVRIRYWIDNASDVMATDVELSFGDRDGMKLGTAATQPVLNPGANMVGQVTIPRALYNRTDDPCLIVSWTDDEGSHVEQREPGSLPRRGPT
jgi:hypothetical protein